ncbi:hypothetical protein V6N13_060751 [Hibiscus sabdariffa]
MERSSRRAERHNFSRCKAFRFHRKVSASGGTHSHSLQSRRFSVNRVGVSIFVNFVSKNIHPQMLKVAFEEYGRVLDVYITYNNVRRAANNRFMDGFKIKAFIDKKVSPVLNSGGVGGTASKVDHKKVVHAKGVDECSYKDVLLGKTTSKGAGYVAKDPNVVPKLHEIGVGESPSDHIVGLESQEKVEGASSFVPDPILIATDEKNDGWLRNCLIGQISTMYNVGFVQRMLHSEGLKVKVCYWYGFYSVIRFEEEEQLEIFWDLKDTTIKPLFDDVDTVENFMESKKLLIWLCLEGLPLEAWYEFVLTRIASRWGRVIRYDNDTAEKNRLDVGRILIGVNCLSIIPLFTPVELNGSHFIMKVSTVECEDERV